MKNMQRTVDSQEKIDPHRFIRQVGKRPLLSQPKYTTPYEPELFAETFGPPEMEMNDQRRSGILFWNFVDQNGKAAFSMFAEFPAGQKAEEVKKVPVLHGLRHLYSSLLVANKVDVKFAQARLGHASAMTALNIYSHEMTKHGPEYAAAIEAAFPFVSNLLAEGQIAVQTKENVN